LHVFGSVQRVCGQAVRSAGTFGPLNSFQLRRYAFWESAAGPTPALANAAVLSGSSIGDLRRQCFRYAKNHIALEMPNETELTQLDDCPTHQRELRTWPYVWTSQSSYRSGAKRRRAANVRFHWRN
jgi:hypothetical protein